MACLAETADQIANEQATRKILLNEAQSLPLTVESSDREPASRFGCEVKPMLRKMPRLIHESRIVVRSCKPKRSVIDGLPRTTTADKWIPISGRRRRERGQGPTDYLAGAVR